MRTLTSKGIIIKETNSGEADKFITILLKDHGKVTVFCKGARNTKSKFLSSTSIFSYCEFVLFLGAKTPTLISSSLIESFYDLRLDYDRLVIATYFSKISETLILQEVNCDDFIRLLYVAFNNLTKDTQNIYLVKVVFEFKFLEILGVYPASNFCGNCNKDFEDFSNKVFFDINGILCYNCRQNYLGKSILIDNSIVYIINFILNAEINKVFNFTTSDETLKKLQDCSTLFMSSNIAENFNTVLNMLGK